MMWTSDQGITLLSVAWPHLDLNVRSLSPTVLEQLDEEIMVPGEGKHKEETNPNAQAHLPPAQCSKLSLWWGVLKLEMTES